MKEIVTKKDVKDKQGWTIPKGTTLFIIKELKNPMTKKEELIVYVDNGTGQKNLMPKTLVEKCVVI
jgi:hypothetical protein